MLQSMFGPYRIEELLGRGGMGEVYRAYDTKTDRMVALKLLPAHLAEDDEYQARFRRECKVAARLNEPHVVPIHHYGEIDGRLYLDMRLVDGTDLSAWLRANGPLAADVAVAVVGQVAQALDAAHKDGLVHRDIKPSNVLLAGVTNGVEVDAASVFAYLFDFGIARARDGALSPDELSLTMAGVMPGSPSYVAPERFRGVEGDPRADVYSLACVLHQALVGRPPFEGDLPSLMRAHLQAPAPKASTLRPGVPTGLDDVVARGMAKEPADRYATAGALAGAARAVIAASQASGVHPHVPADRTVNLGDRTVAGAVGTVGTGTPVTTPRPGLAEQRPPTPRTERIDTPTRRPARPVTGTSAGPAYATSSRQAPQPTYGAIPPPIPHQAFAPPVVTPVPAPARRKRTSIPLVLTALLLSAVVAIGAVSLLSELNTPTTGGTSGSSGSTTTSRAPLTEDEKLLAGLPTGFSDANCDPDPQTRDKVGAVAYVNCNNGPADGPGTASFARFATTDALEQEFLRAAGDARIVASPSEKIDVCREGRTNLGPWGRNTNTNVVSGQVACVVARGNGAAYLLWSDEETRSFGYVTRADGKAAVLYDWWAGANFRLL
ncbi:serine/threonine-protein kinase [Pseudonocardia sp.]|uniref:serine/threonine-protein kinase n=1 Tax=Pseudonocardia sp. TaxID=60912 RepID=UPI003D098EF8